MNRKQIKTVLIVIGLLALEADFEQSLLVLTEQGGDGLKQTVPIHLVCASQQTFLPMVPNYSAPDHSMHCHGKNIAKQRDVGTFADVSL